MKKIIKAAVLFVSVFFITLVPKVFSHPAWGIVVDRNKQVYFSDLETIYKIDAQGKLSIFRAGASGRHVHDLSIDALDNIYGIENSYNPQNETFPRGIWKMSPRGEFSYLVPMTVNLPLGMSIWQDSVGNTYSVEPYNNEKKESKIIKRAPDGKTSLFAGGKYGYLDGQKDKAQFAVITDISFGTDGTIYLTGGDKIRKIDKSNNVTTIYNGQGADEKQKTSENSSTLFGLDVDTKNNVFAADFGKSRVLKISFDGKISTFLNSEKDWSPIGVAAADDEIYVLEGRPFSAAIHTGNRVLKISADGRSTVLASLESLNKANNDSSVNNNLSRQTEAKSDFVSKFDAGKIDSTNNASNFYAIVGAAGIAFIAVGFIVWRKFN
jgi:hypothetical protein